MTSTRDFTAAVGDQREELERLRAEVAEWRRRFAMGELRDIAFSNSATDVEPLYTALDVDPQSAENLGVPGTYPFTLDHSVKAYRLNNFLHDLIEPQKRRQFLADPEPMFQAAELTEQERDMVRRRDWRALIQYGAIFFVLEKLGAVSGVSNLHIYAAMRGQSLEEFQKTRNAQVLYSVAPGQPAS